MCHVARFLSILTVNMLTYIYGAGYRKSECIANIPNFDCLTAVVSDTLLTTEGNILSGEVGNRYFPTGKDLHFPVQIGHLRPTASSTCPICALSLALSLFPKKIQSFPRPASSLARHTLARHSLRSTLSPFCQYRSCT